jgi:hypothetical protein
MPFLVGLNNMIQVTLVSPEWMELNTSMSNPLESWRSGGCPIPKKYVFSARIGIGITKVYSEESKKPFPGTNFGMTPWIKCPLSPVDPLLIALGDIMEIYFSIL